MYVLLDIGGTNIRIGISTNPKVPEISAFKEFLVTNNYQQDFDILIMGIKELTKGHTIDGICLSIAGELNEDKSGVRNSPNLFAWNNREIKKDLYKEFKCNILIENDCFLSALGEKVYTNKDNFIFIIWGSGIGGTQCINDNIYLFEPGHQIIEHNSNKKCHCGQNGCLELFAGGAYIKIKYQKNVSELNEEEWNEVISYLSQGIVNLLAIRPTKNLIFGGGIILHQQHRLVDINKLVYQNLKIVEVPSMGISTFKEQMGLIGALAMFNQ